MIRQSYMDFVSLFSEMNPFELGHFSEALFNNLEDLHTERHGEGDMPFSIQDTEYVLTRAMRNVELELAQTRMDDAKMQLEKAKARTFSPRKVTPEDEERVARMSTRLSPDKVAELPDAKKKQSA